MIKPMLQDDALLADIDQAPDSPDRFHLWWLGQSGFLIKYQSRFLLFDPYLSDSLTRKYADTDKPHVRMTELAIDPARLDFIHVVTSSHNHTDHLDGETLTALRQANPKMKLIVPEANRVFAADRLNMDPVRLIGLDDRLATQVAGFTIEGTPAAHETLNYDDAGRLTHLGYLARFGPFIVYHSGDTMLYDGMAQHLRDQAAGMTARVGASAGVDQADDDGQARSGSASGAITVALLPINGRAPERRVAGNLFGEEAARLARDIGAGVAIPCHYDMFEFNTASPDAFAGACQALGQRFAVLQCGQRYSVGADESPAG